MSRTSATIALGTSTIVAALVAAGCSSTGLSPYEQGGQTQSAYIRAVTENGAANPKAVAVGPESRIVNAAQPATAAKTAEQASIKPAAPVTPPPPFKGPANVAVAQVGEVAPPEPLMLTLRQHPQLFGRVNVVPARLDSGASSRYYAKDRDPATATSVDPVVRDHIESLCATATSMGMNYLLLVGGTVDHETNLTPLSLLDLTIVGAFVLPSNETRATVKATGALIDLPTRQVVAISSAEIEAEQYTPSASTDGENRQLFRKMADEVAKKLAAEVVADCGGPRVVDGRKAVSKAK